MVEMECRIKLYGHNDQLIETIFKKIYGFPLKDSFISNPSIINKETIRLVLPSFNHNVSMKILSVSIAKFDAIFFGLLEAKNLLLVQHQTVLQPKIFL